MGQKSSQTNKFELKNFKDVYDYCYINGIMDINSFIESCFKKGFDIEKYGLLGNEDKIIEKEIIKEIRVEVPVEKIVEVIKYVDREIIKEVPVEKVVTKIENICYNPEENELLLKIQQLESENKKFSTMNSELESKIQEFSNITQETTKIFQDNNDEKVKMLQGTLQNLKKQLSLKEETIKELENKIKELENLKINQGAVFMKSSNLSQNL